MKNLLLVFLNLLSVASLAQSTEAELIQVTKEGIREAKEVTFTAAGNTLQIGDLLFPVSTNTHVKLKHENSIDQVEFFLQKNTTIRSITDSSFKRAWFALPFKSQSEAKEFVRLFQKVSISH